MMIIMIIDHKKYNKVYVVGSKIISKLKSAEFSLIMREYYILPVCVYKSVSVRTVIKVSYIRETPLYA